MKRANLLRVELKITTDLGSIRINWEDAASLLALTDPQTPARTVREIADNVCKDLAKLSHEERR